VRVVAHRYGHRNLSVPTTEYLLRRR
jgi:hypothetical protein